MKLYKCNVCEGEGRVIKTERGMVLPLAAHQSSTDKEGVCPKCDGDGWLVVSKEEEKYHLMRHFMG